MFNKSSTEPRHHGDLFKIFNFPDSKERDLARAAEIYERTLVNIRKHIEERESLNANTTDFNYKDLLSEEHLELLARLSGCTAHRLVRNCSNVCYHAKYRSIDGSCNNLENPTWGASLTGFRRILPPTYEDNFSSPIGWNKERLYYGFKKPLARLISTSLISTEEITPDTHITHMMMQWGQFLDHDLDHALPAVSSESWDGADCKKTCDYASPCFPMEAPPNDPRIKNRRCIDFIRSSSVCGSGMTSVFFNSIEPREQLNQLTSFIDASQVYGYKEDFAQDLRNMESNEGILREGVQLKDQKPLLPYASPGDMIDCRRNLNEHNIDCFVAGDIRVNEQVGLLAMHVIWFREHNRLARALKRINSHWSSDILYNEARKIVGAQAQHITYTHWLPKILGPEGMEMLGEYKGYDPTINPSISNEFATAALRFGHTLINPILHRLNETFQEIPQGHLPLGKAFFAPWRLVFEGGVDPLMRGLYTIPAKLKMPQQNLNKELTEKLFTTAHAVSLDLAAMNIQRARDHGIPGYTEYRKFCNLSSVETFDDLKNEISSLAVRNKLKELYGHPGNIDIFVGGILEDQVEGGKIGPLFRCLLVEQFRRLRDGDRLWYENPKVFSPEQLNEIKTKSSLGKILCDNGDNITLITDDVFVLPGVNGFKKCETQQSMDLYKWVDCNACSNTCRSNTNLHRVRRSTRSKREADSPSVMLQTMYHSNLTHDTRESDNEIEYDMNEERIEGLEALVERFEKSLKQVRRKLKKLEQSIDNTKPKQHGHCVDDEGIRRLNNEIWSKNECINCECVHHQVNCTQQICPELNCPKEYIIKEVGKCCSICSIASTSATTLKH